MKKLYITLAAAALLATSPLSAQVNKPIEMPFYDYPIIKGNHYETVMTNCLMCHSFGYVLNQGKQNRSYWTNTVRKMVDEFKAQISKEDRQIIINYLVKYYGDGK